MSSTTINASTTGYVDYSGTGYPPSYNAAIANNDPYTSRSNTGSGQYDICVGLLNFNTSSLGAGAVVTAATLKLWTYLQNNADSLNLNADYYNWGASPDSTDFANPVGTDAGSKSLATLAYGAYTSITLGNLSNIDVSGTTYIRIGVSGASPSGMNDVITYGYDKANPPQLVITYTDPPVAKSHSLTGGIACNIAESVTAINSHALSAAMAGSTVNTVDSVTAHALTAGIAGSIDESVTALSSHTLTAGVGANASNDITALSDHALAAGIAAEVTNSVEVPRLSAVTGGIAAAVANTITATTTVVLPIAKIADHTAQALDRLAEQFR
jgi:hypothetical protein